jgi:hypothetical protein
MSTRVPWSAPGTIEAVPQSARAAAAIASGSVVQARDAAPVREAHRYAQINGSVVFQTIPESALILPAPQNFRNLLMLRNAGATAILIDFGRDATASSTIELQPNQIILFDTVVPQDDTYAISPGGISTLSVSFSNINFLESAG